MKQRSWIFPFFPQPWHDIKGDRFNLVGDIRLHFSGVEGIEFPPFPHLRPTESRARVWLFFSLSDTPLIFPCILFSHHTLGPTFFMLYFRLPSFLSCLLCFPLFEQTLSGLAAVLRGLLGLPAAFLQLRRCSLRSSVWAMCRWVTDNVLPCHASLIMFKLTGWSLLWSSPHVFFSQAAVLRFHALLERENIFLFVLNVCSLCHIYKTYKTTNLKMWN